MLNGSLNNVSSKNQFIIFNLLKLPFEKHQIETLAKRDVQRINLYAKDRSEYHFNSFLSEEEKISFYF